MQRLLTEDEYQALVAGDTHRFIEVRHKLQEACTLVADHMILPVVWGRPFNTPMRTGQPFADSRTVIHDRPHN